MVRGAVPSPLTKPCHWSKTFTNRYNSDLTCPILPQAIRKTATTLPLPGNDTAIATMPNYLIVCGPPRSGTRFMANALNARRDTSIAGEVPPPLISSACHLIAQSDAEMKHFRSDWEERRHHSFHTIIKALQKYGYGRSDAEFRGFKTPYAELLLQDLKQVFDRFSMIYCLRDFRSHWLSCVARWPKNSIERRAGKYIESLQSAFLALDDPGIRFAAFSLERLKRLGREHIGQIARRLDLPDDPGWPGNVDPGERANSAEKFNKVRRSALNDEEERYVTSRPELVTLYEKFWETYDAQS